MFVTANSATFMLQETAHSPLTVGSARTRAIEDATIEAHRSVKEADGYIDGCNLLASCQQIIMIRGTHWKIHVYKPYGGKSRIVCEVKVQHNSRRDRDLKNGVAVWEKLTEKLSELTWLDRSDE